MSTETKHPALQYMEELHAERIARRLEALDRLKEHHRAILVRRGGEPIDVDAVLDEMRGRTDGDEAP